MDVDRSPNQEYLHTLHETFKCFICMEKIKDARLCPHCSKLCCYSCITRWLTEQRSQCPHCRATLNLHEVVNCRWVEELSDQLDSLNASNDSKKARLLNKEIRCETHGEKLTVFCVTCDTTICHRCALFDSSGHRGHSFRPIEEKYYDTLTELGQICDKLKDKQKLIKKHIKDIDKNINKVHQAKEQKVLEIRAVVEYMILDIEKDLKDKITILTTQKTELVKESEQLKETVLECDSDVMRMPMSQLIYHSHELTRIISSEQNRQIPALKSVNPDFHNQLIPTFEGGTLEIKSFSDKKIKNDPIYSLPIGCNGVSWRLKVYPNGNGIVRDRYLSVFLELTSGPPGVSRYEYRIEMIVQAKINDESKNVLREFTSDFEIGECWGYNRFFRLDLMHTEGFLKQDSLLFKFSVRPPTYYQKCREQQWYLSKLELERPLLLQQFEELKQKVPATVKPINKDLPSPTKKKIKIQTLLDEFKCAETTDDLRNPDTDEDIQKNVSFWCQPQPPAINLQTLSVDEYKSRLQEETTLSMLERLDRMFKESNNTDESLPKNLTDSPLDIDEHSSEPEVSAVKCNKSLASAMAPKNPIVFGSNFNLNNPFITNHAVLHGIQNPPGSLSLPILNNQRTRFQGTNHVFSNSHSNIDDIAISIEYINVPNEGLGCEWAYKNGSLNDD